MVCGPSHPCLPGLAYYRQPCAGRGGQEETDGKQKEAHGQLVTAWIQQTNRLRECTTFRPGRRVDWTKKSEMDTQCGMWSAGTRRKRSSCNRSWRRSFHGTAQLRGKRRKWPEGLRDASAVHHLIRAHLSRSLRLRGQGRTRKGDSCGRTATWLLLPRMTWPWSGLTGPTSLSLTAVAH